MGLTLARLSTVDLHARSPPDPHGDRGREAGRIGPALLREGGGAEANRGAAADVAEAVVGAVAAVVVGAGDEDRAPAVGRLLEVLDRHQLAATRDRRPSALALAAKADRLPRPQARGHSAQRDAGADPQLQRRPPRRL